MNDALELYVWFMRQFLSRVQEGRKENQGIAINNIAAEERELVYYYNNN